MINHVNATVFEVDAVRRWHRPRVIDDVARRIGSLDAIYVDVNEVPVFAAVRVGVLGLRRLVFVPLRDATVEQGHVRVAYGRAAVKTSPAIGMNRELLPADEKTMFDYYGLPCPPVSGGGRRVRRR